MSMPDFLYCCKKKSPKRERKNTRYSFFLLRWFPRNIVIGSLPLWRLPRYQSPLTLLKKRWFFFGRARTRISGNSFSPICHVGNGWLKILGSECPGEIPHPTTPCFQPNMFVSMILEKVGVGVIMEAPFSGYLEPQPLSFFFTLRIGQERHHKPLINDEKPNLIWAQIWFH